MLCNGDKQTLITLYERCARQFKDSEQYRNDIRYLKIWIEFASHTRDPIDIYRFFTNKQNWK